MWRVGWVFRHGAWAAARGLMYVVLVALDRPPRRFVPPATQERRYACPLHGPVPHDEVEHASSEIAYHAPGGSVCGPLRV